MVGANAQSSALTAGDVDAVRAGMAKSWKQGSPAERDAPAPRASATGSARRR